MFNRKRIEELQKTIGSQELEIRKLDTIINSKNEEIIKLHQMIDEITALKDKLPEDCVPGLYCESCKFVKEYHHPEHFYTKTYYVCAKSGACPRFIQKEGDR